MEAHVLLRVVCPTGPFTAEHRWIAALGLAILIHTEWLQDVSQISFVFIIQGLFSYRKLSPLETYDTRRLKYTSY